MKVIISIQFELKKQDTPAAKNEPIEKHKQKKKTDEAAISQIARTTAIVSHAIHVMI
ncbi:MAG: hypothetical protein LBR59_00495 [Endomicrobium sp.]|nr:hypothetical protein [Endomicrobium sp.]